MNEPRPSVRPSLGFVNGVLACVLALAALIASAKVAQAAGPALVDPAAPRVRKPMALAISRDGSWLYVANRQSGSLSVVETRTAKVVAEHNLGRGLADVAVIPESDRLVAVDQAGDALLLLEAQGRSVRIVGRQDVAAGPVKVVAAPDGRACSVASIWARRMTFITVAAEPKAGQPALSVAGTLELPFSPREMVWAAGGAKLIVGDAFGAKLAVVDVQSLVIDSVRTLPGHSIRGLLVTADARTLIVLNQSINRSAKTNFDDIHWGVLLNNNLRSLRMDAVLSQGSDADLLSGSYGLTIGTSGFGAGDPAAMIADRAGGLAIALSGVDEVSFARTPTAHFRRHGVGARPSALALRADGRAVYVANSLNDTVSEVEINSGLLVRIVSLGARPEATLVEQGERLFYDARLSHDGWMSCHTCHTDGHSNGQLADTLGDGSYGAPKRVPSLLGTAATGPWTWTGSIDRLDDQVRKSVEKTMRGPELTDRQVQALTAYLRSLEPPRAATEAPAAAVARGREVFREQSCGNCHAAPQYTAHGTYDVGLSDQAGNTKFNPPSLLGVGVRTPLLHDGRAATLDDVFLKHKHPDNTEMTPAEVADLVAFLKSL